MKLNRVAIRNGIKNLANNALNRYKLYYRRKDWLDFAERNTECTVLTDSQKERVDAFYRPYGKKISYAFHAFYLEKTKVFSEKIIPEDFYFCYVDPFFNDWDRARVMDNKCNYSLYFSGVKMPETVAKRMNGLWFDGDMGSLSVSQLCGLMEQEETVFIKEATESYGGFGVTIHERDQGNSRFLQIIDQIDGDIVIQKPIVQHDRLSAVNASSVNSIRVLSLLSKDGVKVYSSVLRMGMNGAKVGNSSSGGICCGINPDGTLKKYAYTGTGIAMLEHPDSKLVFEGYSIPGFREIMDTVKKLHCQIPHFRLVSWDFSVDQDAQPVLIESNLSYGGIKVHQMTNGPIFGEDTVAILNEVFGL